MSVSVLNALRDNALVQFTRININSRVQLSLDHLIERPVRFSQGAPQGYSLVSYLHRRVRIPVRQTAGYRRKLIVGSAHSEA